MKPLLLFISTLLVLDATQAAKILCVLPLPAKSHTLLLETLCRELAARNHEVTALTAFPPSKPLKNYNEISLNLSGDLHERLQVFQSRKYYSALGMLIFIMRVVPPVLDNFLSHPETQRLLESKQHFDLVVTQNYLTESVIGGFSHKFNAPVVTLSVIMANLWSNYQVGNPAPLAYIPDPFLGKPTDMNLFERTWNVVFDGIHRVLYYMYMIPLQEDMMRRHFGGDLPPLTELLKNVSFAFVNHHFSMAFPRSYAANFVEIGGMHVTPPKPLPQDIQKFLDNAKDGAILFSLGSNARSIDLPEERLKVFRNVFAKVNMPVLWKWESEHFDGKPDNVKVGKWLPQSDILAHPNLKLFVTHGGFGSVLESVYHGVPIVGLPLFAEQPLNLINAEHAGYGIKVDFDQMTEDDLSSAIHKVLNEPRYRDTAKHRSVLLKDTPLKAMDTAMFWIDYVIRHKGARHMRSQEQNLSWYQLYLLDVFALLGAIVTIILFINYLLLKVIVKSLFQKSKKPPTKKNKKNK